MHSFEDAIWLMRAAHVAGEKSLAWDYYHQAYRLAKKSGRLQEFSRFLLTFNPEKARSFPKKKKSAMKK